MQHLPKRIYSRKRIRSSSTAPLTSSPSDIGGADISVSDMSQRMFKRSRSGIKGKRLNSNQAQGGDAGNLTMRPLKRVKSGVGGDSTSLAALKDKNQNASESYPGPAKDKMDLFVFPDAVQSSPTADMGRKPRNPVKMLTSSPLKENIAPLISPKTQSSLNLHDNAVNTLASPFKARSPIASSTPIRRDRDRQRKLARTRSSANLSRRRSSNTGYATHIEPSNHIKRRPSAQITSSYQMKRQSDWLVPAQLSGVLTSALAQKSDAKIKFGSADFTFDFTAFKEIFEVPPNACSTPAVSGHDSLPWQQSVHAQGIPAGASFPVRRTPEPYSTLPMYDLNEDIICDSVPRTRIKNFNLSEGIACDPGDSIPSHQAAGLTYSPPKARNTGSLADELEKVATREERQREPSSVSQTGELQELFSDLGLHDIAEYDGDGQRVPVSKRWKRVKRSDHKRTSSSKAVLVGSNVIDGNGKHSRKDGNRHREKTGEGSVRLSPLWVDEDDEDDELLLTSRGWDWDPVKGRRMTMMKNVPSL